MPGWRRRSSLLHSTERFSWIGWCHGRCALWDWTHQWLAATLWDLSTSSKPAWASTGHLSARTCFCAVCRAVLQTQRLPAWWLPPFPVFWKRRYWTIRLEKLTMAHALRYLVVSISCCTVGSRSRVLTVRPAWAQQSCQSTALSELSTSLSWLLPALSQESLVSQSDQIQVLESCWFLPLHKACHTSTSAIRSAAGSSAAVRPPRMCPKLFTLKRRYWHVYIFMFNISDPPL